MALTTEQARQFDIYEQMFVMDGWKDLVEDFTERKANLSETVLRSTKTERELGIAQGMASVYTYIIELANLMDHAKKQALTEQQSDGALN